MNYEEADRKIKYLIDSEWSSVTSIVWPNEIEDSLGDPDYFARVSIFPVSGRNVAIGPNCHRRRGVIMMQLFARQGTGTAALGALEEKAVRVFTDNAVSHLRFFDAGADR